MEPAGHDKCDQQLQLEARGQHTFRKPDAALTYSHDDGCFYVVHVPGAHDIAARASQVNHAGTMSVFIQDPDLQGGHIVFRKLPPAHQQGFVKSCQQEADSLVGAGALRIMTPSE